MMLNFSFIKGDTFTSVFLREIGTEPEVTHGPSLQQIKDISRRILFSVPTSNELLHKIGGNWLGRVREFIKGRFLNGDSVTWASNDILRSPRNFTVAEMEHLASDIAESAIKERSDNLQSLIGFLIHEIELRDNKIAEYKSKTVETQV